MSNNELKSGETPRVSAKSDANGVLGYFDTEHLSKARHFENFITVNFFGTDGGIFYHPYKASVEMKVHVLTIPDMELNVRTGNFIAAALKRSLNGFGYGSQLSSSKLKKLDFRIKFPTKNGKIDFNFMESFIAELEAYLSASGLKDTTLTAEEQQALADFENGKLSWGEFTYQNIFNHIAQGRRLKKDDQIAGSIPFVMAGITNTGVVNYISNPVASFPKNAITIDIFGNAFYRNYSFGAGDDTGVYWSDQKNYAKETMLFFTTAMEKSILGQFSYGKKLRSSQSLGFKMKLLTQNHQPDLASMETFISAIQKLVIKDVVLYADKKIAATKQVVQS